MEQAWISSCRCGAKKKKLTHDCHSFQTKGFRCPTQSGGTVTPNSPCMTIAHNTHTSPATSASLLASSFTSPPSNAAMRFFPFPIAL